MSNYKDSTFEQVVLWGATIAFSLSIVFGIKFLYDLVSAYTDNQPLFTEPQRVWFVRAISSFGMFLILGAVNDELDEPDDDEDY
jgi:hypothetical protein